MSNSLFRHYLTAALHGTASDVLAAYPEDPHEDIGQAEDAAENIVQAAGLIARAACEVEDDMDTIRPSWSRVNQRLIDWAGRTVTIVLADDETGNVLVERVPDQERELAPRWSMSADEVLRCFPVGEDGRPTT